MTASSKIDLRELPVDAWHAISTQYSLLPSRPGQRTRLSQLLEAAKLPLETQAGPPMPLWTRRPDVVKHLHTVIEHLERLKAPVAKLIWYNWGRKNQPCNPETDAVTVVRISATLEALSQGNYRPNLNTEDIFVVIRCLMTRLVEDAGWRNHLLAFLDANDRDFLEDYESLAVNEMFSTFPMQYQEIICKMDYNFQLAFHGARPPMFDRGRRNASRPQMVDFAFRLSGTLVKARRARLLFNTELYNVLLDNNYLGTDHRVWPLEEANIDNWEIFSVQYVDKWVSLQTRLHEHWNAIQRMRPDGENPCPLVYNWMNKERNGNSAISLLRIAIHRANQIVEDMQASVATITKSLKVVQLAYLQFASDWYGVKQGGKSLQDQYRDANLTSLYDLKFRRD